MNICNSIIHNGPSLEATKMSFIMNRWETMVHSDTGVYLVLKRKELSKKKKKKGTIKTWKDTEETYVHITQWKKPVWKVYLLYDFQYVIFWNGKAVETVKVSGYWG